MNDVQAMVEGCVSARFLVRGKISRDVFLLHGVGGDVFLLQVTPHSFQTVMSIIHPHLPGRVVLLL